MYLFRRVVLALILFGSAAAPAVAKDCFIRVQVGTAPRAAPVHRPLVHRALAAPVHAPVKHRVHHLVGRPHPRHPQVAAAAAPEGPGFAESSIAQASVPVYELRPISCDTQPAIQSKAPALAPPGAQKLLDELVTPAPPLSPPPAPVAPEGVTIFPDTGAPGPVVAGPPGAPEGTLPPLSPPLAPPAIGGPLPVLTPVATPPVTTPPGVTPPVGTPPVVTPPVTPPGGPPVVTPPGVTPPVVTPPLTPTDTPAPVLTPVVVPPAGPPGGPPLAPVPEPSEWALMLAGFVALGAVLRARRAAALRARRPEVGFE